MLGFEGFVTPTKNHGAKAAVFQLSPDSQVATDLYNQLQVALTVVQAPSSASTTVAQSVPTDTIVIGDGDEANTAEPAVVKNDHTGAIGLSTNNQLPPVPENLFQFGAPPQVSAGDIARSASEPRVSNSLVMRETGNGSARKDAFKGHNNNSNRLKANEQSLEIARQAAKEAAREAQRVAESTDLPDGTMPDDKQPHLPVPHSSTTENTGNVESQLFRETNGVLDAT